MELEGSILNLRSTTNWICDLGASHLISLGLNTLMHKMSELNGLIPSSCSSLKSVYLENLHVESSQFP